MHSYSLYQFNEYSLQKHLNDTVFLVVPLNLRDSCNIKHSTTVLLHFILPLCSFSLSISVTVLAYFIHSCITNDIKSYRRRLAANCPIRPVRSDFLSRFVASTLLSILVTILEKRYPYIRKRGETPMTFYVRHVNVKNRLSIRRQLPRFSKSYRTMHERTCISENESTTRQRERERERERREGGGRTQ